MDILIKALGALWQVLLVGVVLGAGLPALFALGLRSLNTGRVSSGVAVGAGAATTSEDTSKPSTLGLAGAIVCFGILILAVLFGIVVIIFGNKIFG